MMTYKVEMYLDAISGYDTHTKFEPDYVWTVMKLRKRWWLPWPKVEIGVVMNLRSAEKQAWKRALNHAKILKRKAKVKVMRVTELGGKKTSTCVWDNGVLMDLKLIPLWQRWVLRLGRRYFKRWVK
jgi:hypothetical protein